MTKKNPIDNLKPYKPGQSGNPSGKPAGLLTKDQVSSVMGKFSHSTREQLQAVITNPKSTMLEIMVASVMARAAKDGDPNRMEFLLQRTIGKVQDLSQIELKKWDAEFEQLPRQNILDVLRKDTGT